MIRTTISDEGDLARLCGPVDGQLYPGGWDADRVCGFVLGDTRSGSLTEGSSIRLREVGHDGDEYREIFSRSGLTARFSTQLSRTRKVSVKILIAEKPNQGRLLRDVVLEDAEEIEGGVWSDGDDWVVSLRGQVFELTETEDTGDRPSFPELQWRIRDDWIETYERLSDLLPESDETVIATDYDREGELIGTLAVLLPQYGEIDYDRLDASRMRYSALTESEIEDAWQDRGDPDANLFWTGHARAVIDYEIGMNLSDALTQCVLSALGDWEPMSAGRVQTPLLKIVADRTRRRWDHDPETYWVPSVRV